MVVVSRDHSSVYANAIRNACPEAIQVADRWHLLKNLGENMVRILNTLQSLITETAQEVFNSEDISFPKPIPGPAS